ncbi:MAG: hypothetical protein AAF802_08490 [Planctomycetota bacterium]
MEFITLKGTYLQRKIRALFGSVDRLLEDGRYLVRAQRATIYRAIRGRPIAKDVAIALAQSLGCKLDELSVSPLPRIELHLSQESLAFYEAVDALSGSDGRVHLSILSGQQLCVGEWLRTVVDLPDSLVEAIAGELCRVGLIERAECGGYRRADQDLRKTTKQLKRRVQFQWPMIRDAFSQPSVERKEISQRIRELVDAAQQRIADPISFFSIDDEIHACFCVGPYDRAMLQSARAVSWQIAHRLVADLATTPPADVQLTMTAVGGWMLEDYEEWSSRLVSGRPSDLRATRKGFRRHVLRMRDYVQYFQYEDSNDGSSAAPQLSIAT